MRAWGRLVWAWVMLAVGSGLVSLQAVEDSRIVVRGGFVCLGAVAEQSRTCSSESVGIRTAEDRLSVFRPADSATALLADPRLRDREFYIMAPPHEDDRLESMCVRVIRDGQAYDASYVCEVCRITSSVPGLCPCCPTRIDA